MSKQNTFLSYFKAFNDKEVLKSNILAVHLLLAAKKFVPGEESGELNELVTELEAGVKGLNVNNAFKVHESGLVFRK